MSYFDEDYFDDCYFAAYYFKPEVVVRRVTNIAIPQGGERIAIIPEQEDEEILLILLGASFYG